jgi:peptidyl-prolyl cis-trans isomerase B (cyclophilin B)
MNLGSFMAPGLTLLFAGCGQKTAVAEKPSASPVVKATVPETTPSPALDPRMHQSFTDATTSEPPPEWHVPPETTMTNKSVGKLYTEVVSRWEQIKFVSPAGKPLTYRATLDTEMGPIEIALRPDLAPNHVRSFVALAQVGYYNGLVFDRTVREGVDGRADGRRELIEAGCPKGTGEAGYGSIGYWLKPEFSSQATHEEGIVGASRGEEKDTAACKFYINLYAAPFMDGNYTVFGKVTQGLDVARKILSLPVRNDPEFPDGDRPVKPVVIRKVTIHAQETAASGPT